MLPLLDLRGFEFVNFRGADRMASHICSCWSSSNARYSDHCGPWIASPVSNQLLPFNGNEPRFPPLWIDFANSHARDHLGHGQHEDRLENPGWIQEFANKWQLRPQTLRSKPQREPLRRLRSLLERCVQSIVRREPVSKSDIEELNRYLSQKVRPKLKEHDGSFRLELVSPNSGVHAWLFAIAASFAEFLVEADPTRLKMCGNPDCLWVFYDSTRSRTRRWCAVGCGDLIKVREFRERQKGKK